MDNWKEYKIGDLCEVGRGSSPRPIIDARYFKDGTIPWIKIADATASAKYIYQTKEYVNEFGASFSRILEPNSLILAASGTLGQVNFLGVKGCIHDGWLYMSNYKNNLLDKEFLYYYLKTIGKEFENLSYGAAIQNINTTILRNTKIKIPPVSLQKQIAHILSNYDDLIDINSQRIKILEETTQQLYKEWFVRMRFPNYKKTKFEKGIPKDWEIVRIDSLYKTSSGGTPSREKEEYYKHGIYNWIKTGELNDSFIFETDEKITELGLNKSSAKLFPPYTTIFAMYGNTIGQLGITTQTSSTNQACCAFLPLTKTYDFEFLFLTLFLNRNEIISFGMGAAQQNVNQDELKKYKIIKPTESIALKFKEIVNPMFMQIKNLQLQNTQLRQIRDRLLPRLISGKLQVKEQKELKKTQLVK